MQFLNMCKTCPGLSSSIFFRILFSSPSDPDGAIFVFSVLVDLFISVSMTRAGFSSADQLASSFCGWMENRPSTMASISPEILMPGVKSFLHSLAITTLNGMLYESLSTNLQSLCHKSFSSFVNFSFASSNDSFSATLASVPTHLRLR